MTLTKSDLTDIRGVILDALDTVVNPRFDRIETQLDEHTQILNEHGRILQEHGSTLREHGRILQEHTALLNDHGKRLAAIEAKIDDVDGRLRAIEADVKELYALLGNASPTVFTKDFAQLSPAEQVLKLHHAITALAKQLHVEL